MYHLNANRRTNNPLLLIILGKKLHLHDIWRSNTQTDTPRGQPAFGKFATPSAIRSWKSPDEFLLLFVYVFLRLDGPNDSFKSTLCMFTPKICYCNCKCANWLTRYNKFVKKRKLFFLLSARRLYDSESVSSVNCLYIYIYIYMYIYIYTV
jgi:hypothetical protein